MKGKINSIEKYNSEDLEQYIREVKDYPSLSQEEAEKLICEYKEGNFQARQKLIQSYLMLVVSAVKGYLAKTSAFTFFDLIQEGNIILITAIEKYDPTKSNFSTYLINTIQNRIKRKISEKDKLIKVPSHIFLVIKRYNNLIKEYYEKHQKYPSDSYIQKTLEIGEATLDYLKNKDMRSSFLSMEYREDQESPSLGDSIRSPKDDISKVLEMFDEFDFLNIIRSFLTEKEYYILYFRVLANKTKTLEELAKELGVTHEAIRLRQNKAIEKLKPFVEKDCYMYKKKLIELREYYKADYYNLKTIPLEIENIYKFLYVQEDLSQLQCRIFYLKFIDRFVYTEEELRKKLQLTKENFREEMNSFNNIVRKKFVHLQDYLLFKKELIKEKKVDVFKINFDLLAENKVLKKTNR